MKKIAVLATLAMLQISCTSSDSRQVDLINAIDAALVMPPNSYRSTTYAKFYASRADGKVEVRMTNNVRDGGPKPPDYGCSQDMGDGTLKEVPCPPDIRPNPGERRWVEYKELPIVGDGGCSFIRAIYNQETHRVEEVNCNGGDRLSNSQQQITN